MSALTLRDLAGDGRRPVNRLPNADPGCGYDFDEVIEEVAEVVDEDASSVEDADENVDGGVRMEEVGAEGGSPEANEESCKN